MRETPGSSPRRAAGTFAAAVVGLLLVLFLGPGRGGTVALLLAVLLPVILPRPRAGGRGPGPLVVRVALAGLLLAGLAAVLLLRSPAALFAAVLLLWVAPLAIGGLPGSREEGPR